MTMPYDKAKVSTMRKLAMHTCNIKVVVTPTDDPTWPYKTEVFLNGKRIIADKVGDAEHGSWCLLYDKLGKMAHLPLIEQEGPRAGEAHLKCESCGGPTESGRRDQDGNWHWLCDKCIERGA